MSLLLGRPYTALPEPSGEPFGELGRVAAAPVRAVEHSGDIVQCRRDAVRLAVEDITALGCESGPVIALRFHQPHGVLVLALGGRFDARAVAGLRGRATELRRFATAELVVDCSQLQGCSTALARSLAHLRARMLIDGVRVQLHAAPDSLVAEIGSTPPRGLHRHRAPRCRCGRCTGEVGGRPAPGVG